MFKKLLFASVLICSLVIVSPVHAAEGGFWSFFTNLFRAPVAQQNNLVDQETQVAQVSSAGAVPSNPSNSSADISARVKKLQAEATKLRAMATKIKPTDLSKLKITPAKKKSSGGNTSGPNTVTMPVPGVPQNCTMIDGEPSSTDPDCFPPTPAAPDPGPTAPTTGCAPGQIVSTGTEGSIVFCKPTAGWTATDFLKLIPYNQLVITDPHPVIGGEVGNATLSVQGNSVNPVGIWGFGVPTFGGDLNTYPGIVGSATRGTGVLGLNRPGDNPDLPWAGIGVEGFGGRGIGVYGSSSGNTGVYGSSYSYIDGSGVTYGGPGVYGYSDTSSGVAGYSADWVGVHGFSNNLNGYGVYGAGRHSGVVGSTFGDNPNRAAVTAFAESGAVGFWQSNTQARNHFDGPTDTAGDVCYYPSGVVGNGTPKCLSSLGTTPTSTPSQWATSGTNIYNSNSGNVGIGTNNPGAKLEVNAPNSQIKISGATTPAVVQVVGSSMKLGDWSSGGNNGISIDLLNGGVTVNKLTGTGNAYACLDSAGKLFRSANPCTGGASVSAPSGSVPGKAPVRERDLSSFTVE